MAAAKVTSAVADDEGSPTPGGKLKTKDYERELARLHVEMVRLQQWVQRKGLESASCSRGASSAGKGGSMKAITERVEPAGLSRCRPSGPTERGRFAVVLQRYIAHLPGAGEVVIFDRSWYKPSPASSG